MDYDKRHGYRGAEGYFDLPQNVSEDALEDALQEQSETDDIYPALVLDADAKNGQGLPQGRRHHRNHRRRTEVCADHDRPEGAQQPQDPARCAHSRAAGRKRQVADRTAAAGRGRAGGHGPERRRDPRAGGRIRLLPQQVQPCHAGLSSAGVQLQALHLLGGSGKGVHGSHRNQRRTTGDRRRRDRLGTLGAEELRRHVRWSDPVAHSADQVEEPGLDPHPAGHHPAVRPGLHQPLRLRSQTASRPT